MVRWRAHGLLTRWWAQGACVAGLLYALDHHPDRPDRGRGDALRGARNPLGVLGHRLTPWSDRLAELPPDRHAVDGDARRRRAATLQDPLDAPRPGPGGRHQRPAASDSRAEARASSPTPSAVGAPTVTPPPTPSRAAG